MIKIISLIGEDGTIKPVPMKSDAAILRVYKSLFHEDLILELTKAYEEIDPKIYEKHTQLEKEKTQLVEESTALFEQKEALSKEIKTLEAGKAPKASVTAKVKELKALQSEFDELLSRAEQINEELEKTAIQLTNAGTLKNFELVENLAYVMASQANKEILNTSITDWLSEFSVEAFRESMDEIMSVYRGGEESTSVRKKK